MAHRCEFPDDSGWSGVMVHYGLKLCEVGQDCPAVGKCEFAYRKDEVEPCPTCGGDPEKYVTSHGGDLANSPWCPTCDVFGIKRKELVQIK